MLSVVYETLRNAANEMPSGFSALVLASPLYSRGKSQDWRCDPHKTINSLD